MKAVGLKVKWNCCLTQNLGVSAIVVYPKYLKEIFFSFAFAVSLGDNLHEMSYPTFWEKY